MSYDVNDVGYDSENETDYWEGELYKNVTLYI